MDYLIKHITNHNLSEFATQSLTDTIYNNFKYLEHDVPTHNKSEIQNLLKSSDMYGLLIYKCDVVVGYLIGEYKEIDFERLVFFVTYIYVSYEHRNNGLGCKLMKRVFKLCEDNDIKWVLLQYDTNNKKLYNFYTKFGFSPDRILRRFDRYDIFCKQILNDVQLS